jgi:DNA-binding response OmpR family regulator
MTAEDVRGALQLAAEHEFDLLVSDVGLPDGSGLDLMRALSERRRIPGIALTGFGRDEDVRRSKEAGFDEHMTKPVSMAKLEASIRRLCAA